MGMFLTHPAIKQIFLVRKKELCCKLTARGNALVKRISDSLILLNVPLSYDVERGDQTNSALLFTSEN